MKKKVNLSENIETAHAMSACGLLLDIALTEPTADKFSVSVMKTAKLVLLSGAAKLKDTSDALSVFLNALVSENRNVNTEDLSENLSSLLNAVKESLYDIADTLEKEINRHGDTV